jgi:hypothetical protein
MHGKPVVSSGFSVPSFLEAGSELIKINRFGEISS